MPQQVYYAISAFLISQTIYIITVKINVENNAL